MNSPVVIHLAPAALATDPEYVEWASRSSARVAARHARHRHHDDGQQGIRARRQIRPRRGTMAHSEATRRAVRVPLGGDDERQVTSSWMLAHFDPRFATRADADADADVNADGALQGDEAEHQAPGRRSSSPDGKFPRRRSKTPQNSGSVSPGAEHVAVHEPAARARRAWIEKDSGKSRRAARARTRASLRGSVAAAESRRVASIDRRSSDASSPAFDPGADVPVPDAIRALREGDAECVSRHPGSSAPAKYRNVTGIFFDAPSRGSAFLDCGEGTYGQMVRLWRGGRRERLVRLRCVWISHIHADHHVGVVTPWRNQENCSARRSRVGI